MKRVRLVIITMLLTIGQIATAAPVYAEEQPSDDSVSAESSQAQPLAEPPVDDSVTQSNDPNDAVPAQVPATQAAAVNSSQDLGSDSDVDEPGPDVVLAEAEKLLISKIRVGSGESIKDEFIELYNPAPYPVVLNGWTVEYLNASHDGGAEPDRLLAEIDDIEIDGLGFFVLANTGYIDDLADAVFINKGTSVNALAQNGSVRLVHNTETIDLAGWGGASQYLGEPAKAEKEQTIERCMGSQLMLVDTANNRRDFAAYQWPKDPVVRQIAPCASGDGSANSDDTDPAVANDCDGLIISEIGSNLDQQFVEVYNPTEQAIDLTGCQISAKRQASKAVFETAELAAKGYQALFLGDSELTLYKTTYDTVYILSSDGTNEVDVVDYDGLKQDTSWALIDDEWRQTYSVTPGEANIYSQYPACNPGYERNLATGRCRQIAVQASSALKPCAPDQERNPETNRCRKIVPPGSSLVPCKPGQERNPATNRCRSTAAAASQLVPCKPGQERNPETNRCRSVAAQASTLKPCQSGYERNPETNRCRKVRSTEPAVAGYAVEPIADSAGATIGWWAFGGVGVLAAGYATWEWRSEIMRAIRGLARLGR